MIVGLGAKDLVTDILAGLFVIFEREFQVGDIIEVSGNKGRVIEIGIRTTKILTVKENLRSINNRNLVNILNKTKTLSYCDVIFPVAITNDMEMVEQALQDAFQDFPERFPEIVSGPKLGGIDEIAGGKANLSIRTECHEADQFAVRAIVNREVIRICREKGIEI